MKSKEASSPLANGANNVLGISHDQSKYKNNQFGEKKSRNEKIGGMTPSE